MSSAGSDVVRAEEGKKNDVQTKIERGRVRDEGFDRDGGNDATEEDHVEGQLRAVRETAEDGREFWEFFEKRTAEKNGEEDGFEEAVEGEVEERCEGAGSGGDASLQ